MIARRVHLSGATRRALLFAVCERAKRDREIGVLTIAPDAHYPPHNSGRAGFEGVGIPVTLEAHVAARCVAQEANKVAARVVCEPDEIAVLRLARVKADRPVACVDSETVKRIVAENYGRQLIAGALACQALDRCARRFDLWGD